jgi:hypothetical protein
MINDANAEQDAITGLRAPTNFGRPNWDMIFKSIRKIHSPAEAGVFFCGPAVLGSQLHIKCNMYSEPGFNFVWGKVSHGHQFISIPRANNVVKENF